MRGKLTPTLRKAAVVGLAVIPLLANGCGGPSSGRVRDGRERTRQEVAPATKSQGKVSERKRLDDLEAPGSRAVEPVFAPSPRPVVAPAPVPVIPPPPAVRPGPPPPSRPPAPALPTREDLAGRPAPENLSIKDIQYLLKELGYDPGTMDGKLGSRTRTALKAFQRDQGLAADGVPGTRTRQELLARAQGSYKQGYRRR